METHPRTLGTALRRLVELLDGEVTRAYTDAGLDFRAGYTPVFRTLLAAESLSVRELATAIGASHAAASSTVRQMRDAGLLEAVPGSDARERRVRLSASALDMAPAVRRLWRRTEAAASALDGELGLSLADAVNAAIGIVERRAFLTAPSPNPDSTPSRTRNPC